MSTGCLGVGGVTLLCQVHAVAEFRESLMTRCKMHACYCPHHMTSGNLSCKVHTGHKVLYPSKQPRESTPYRGDIFTRDNLVYLTPHCYNSPYSLLQVTLYGCPSVYCLGELVGDMEASPSTRQETSNELASGGLSC